MSKLVEKLIDVLPDIQKNRELSRNVVEHCYSRSKRGDKVEIKRI